MLIQVLGVSRFIFSLANHTAGVPTVITRLEFNNNIVSSAGLRDCSAMSGEEDLMRQVEDLKRRLRVTEEEKAEMRRGREEARGREYMMKGSGAGGLASRAMSSAVHMGQQCMEKFSLNNNNDRRVYFPNKQQQQGGHRQQHQWSEG